MLSPEKVLGQKRKQTKLVYRAKAQAEMPPLVLTGALVISDARASPSASTEGGGAEVDNLDDSNKKRRMSSNRSADPAETAEQSRQTQ